METPLRLQPHSAGAPPHYWCHGELVGLRRGDMPLATEELAVIGFSNSFSRTMRTQILQCRIRPWCGQLPCGWALKSISNQPPASPGPETPPAEAKLPSAFESEHKWRHPPCNIFLLSWWPLRRINVLLSNFSTLLRNHICLHCQKAQKKPFIFCIFSIFGL